MRDRIFGWSYPPGVSSLPWDEEYPCEVCGEFPDDCICPECPKCGAHGDPYCYPTHGLHRTFEQKWNFACRNQQWEMENFAENQYYEQMYRDWKGGD